MSSNCKCFMMFRLEHLGCWMAICVSAYLNLHPCTFWATSQRRFFVGSEFKILQATSLHQFLWILGKHNDGIQRISSISRFSSAVRWKLWRSSGAGHGLHETSGLWNISEMSKTSKKPINCGIITGAETTNSTRYPIMIWPNCSVALACSIMFGIRQNVHKTRRVSESALSESDRKGLFFRRWTLQ